MDIENVEEVEIEIEAHEDEFEFDVDRIGPQGYSAYEIWLQEGNKGTRKDFLDSLKGKDGVDGKDGANGIDGKDGYTPIKGVDYFDGKDGTNGIDGTNGKDGKDGKDGIQGPQGVPGEPGVDGKNGENGKDATINGVNTLNIVEGTNIKLEQDGNTLKINSTGGSSYDDTQIWAKVNLIDEDLGAAQDDIQGLQNDVETLDNRIDEIELFKFPNAIIHGTPAINNGQVSNFSRENYLSLPAVFNLHDRGFEFSISFRTGSDVATAQNILGSRFCMALLIENGKLKLRVSQNGTSWDLVDITGSIDIQPNTTYYTQIYFDKLTYKLRYSLDGIEYTDIASKVASVSPNPAQIYIGVGNNFFNPFGGIVNLNRCYLKVNKSVIWAGMDTAGLETRLSTDLENIDELGIEYINGLIDAKIGIINSQLASLTTMPSEEE